MADWKTPEDTKYTENDEWIRVEGGTAKIGLTDYAQDQLSDIVFVNPERSGGRRYRHQRRSVRHRRERQGRLRRIYAPASGGVVAINEALEDSPELVNSDPPMVPAG